MANQNLRIVRGIAQRRRPDNQQRLRIWMAFGVA